MQKVANALFNTKKPKHLCDGLCSGVGNCTKGILTGTLCCLGAPIVGAKNEGLSGCLKGLFAGLCCGFCLCCCGFCTCFTQILKGTWNTPECIIEASRDKEWNEET